MKKPIKYLLHITLLSLIFVGPGIGSDLEKEKRWSQQITDSLLVGDAVQLDAGGTPFLGIFTEAADGSTGRAVILAHGIGIHPDWPEVINPLRSELPEHGWSTLSIQMPVLGNEAELKDYAPLFEEVAPRIRTAVKYLRDRGDKKIVLLGHSLGASMVATYLGGEGQQAVQGFISVGMSLITVDDRMNAAHALEKIRIPILDIYGSRDLEEVLNSSRDRVAAARKSGTGNYRLIEVEGADHFFVGMEDTLTRRVYGWLKTHFENPDRKSP